MKTGLALIGVAVALAFAWLAREVLLLAFFAVVLSVVFAFPVGWLSRIVPRGIAVTALVLVLLGSIAATVAFVAPAVGQQVEDVTRTAPRALRHARDWLRSKGAKNVEEQAGKAAQKASEIAVPALISVVSGTTGAVLVLVLAVYLVARPQSYRDGLRRLVPRDHEPVYDEAYRRTGAALRRWVGGIVVSMAIMGTVTAVGLRIAGINDWVLLGLLTFFGTFVPYLGAIASAVPGLLVAISQSPTHFLSALAVYVGVHFVEGHLVQPLVMRRAVEIRPALLLVGQGVAAAIFGIPGVIVATPSIVCAQTLVGYFWVERRLGK